MRQREITFIIPVKVIKTQKRRVSLARVLLKKLTVLCLLLGLNSLGLSAVTKTYSYFSDTEESGGNFTAGNLDFEAAAAGDYDLTCAERSGEKQITITNLGNPFKYKISAEDFSGGLCDEVFLEASLNNGQAEYSGLLKNFDFGPLDFSEPSVWVLELSLPVDLASSTPGQTCEFKYRLFGSQTRNDLPFGLGFSDQEEISDSIAEPACALLCLEGRTIGYWKNHEEIFAAYLPQTLGAEIIAAIEQAGAVFGADDSLMFNKLKKQLLAMKFNVAHFGAGAYFDPVSDQTIAQLVAAADGLLTQIPVPEDPVLEEMKNTLDRLNNQGETGNCGGGLNDNVKINKVYYDVDGRHGQEPQNEWVELFNPSAQPIDITGWKLCDNKTCDILPGVNVLGAGKFALVTGSTSTWSFWDIPADVLKISLGNPIGNGLANDEDALILKNSEDEIVDQMNWGLANPGWDNYNSQMWTPGAPDVGEGHLLGRVPNEYDTDSPGDWVHLQLPAVQVIYPNGGEVWYVGRTYDILWTAANPNGPASDLKIDLYYSKDSGQTWGNIARDLENTGSYSWRVPLFLENNTYYVPSPTSRIKAVARGPENFMVEDWDQSDRDYCPPIDYEFLTPEEREILEKMEAGEITVPGFSPEQVINEPAENGASASSGGSDFEPAEAENSLEPILASVLELTEESSGAISDGYIISELMPEASVGEAEGAIENSTSSQELLLVENLVDEQVMVDLEINESGLELSQPAPTEAPADLVEANEIETSAVVLGDLESALGESAGSESAADSEEPENILPDQAPAIEEPAVAAPPVDLSAPAPDDPPAPDAPPADQSAAEGPLPTE